MSGVYHSVSDKHLQQYLDGYTFSYNHRGDDQSMQQTVMGRVRRVRHGKHRDYAPLDG